MNYLKLSGVISSDPIIDITNGSIPVVNVMIVDEFKDHKNFINITAFKENATILKSKKPGDEIFIQGHLQQEKWYSHSLKRNLSKIIIVADKVDDAVFSESE